MLTCLQYINSFLANAPVSTPLSSGGIKQKIGQKWVKKENTELPCSCSKPVVIETPEKGVKYVQS